MGKSGNPAKRAEEGGKGTGGMPLPRDVVLVEPYPQQGLVVVSLRGELTGLTPETAEIMATSLRQAAITVRAEQ